MKILVSAINGIGLGHVTRQLALARALRERMPEAKFLFLTTSEAPGIIWQDGFASVKIPSWMNVTHGMLSKTEWLHLCHSLVSVTVANFRPNLLIADSFPQGENGELLPALSTVPNRIFVYDFLPGHDAQKNHQQSIGLYNLVLIPYDEGAFQLPFNIKPAPHWIGPMIYRSRKEALPRAEARRRLGIPEDRLCFYVALGGGGGPETGETMAWLSDIARSFPELLFFQTMPPLASEKSGILKADNARSISHFPLPFSPYLNAFDGAIAGAGANTTTELIHLGLPAVWIPTGSKVAADQSWRAKNLADNGLGWNAERLDGEALSKAIRGMLDADVRREMREKMLAQPEPLGAQKGAEAIEKWLKSQN